MEKPMEVIKSWVYDPRGGLFKNNRNKDKALLHTISCSNKENCQLYEKGQCALMNVMMLSAGYKCPYGNRSRSVSPSQRAHGFRTWVDNAKKSAIDSPIKEASHKMAIVGDYIFLPYAHIGGWHEVDKSIGFVRGFMLIEDFRKHVGHIFKMRPQAVFGGEITDYQKKVVPVMAAHLNELFPDLVQEHAHIAERLPKSYIGRRAVLKSLKPGTVVLDGKGIEWEWDGQFLRSVKWSTPFLPFKGSLESIAIKPEDRLCITITSDSQVDSDTEFDV